MKGGVLAVCIFSGFYALVSADGIYTKGSPVLQITGKNFNSLIEQSNHTSIVEFYAPWCGHCQNLKPAYEKAAKNLAGLAKVAAVDCDEESNKPLCGRMGVQGFPTLKIVRPGSKKGRPAIEDYQGARTAKAIVDAVIDKIPNHVKKVQDAELDTWLAEGSQAKAILFTEKGVIAPSLKALAVDFLGSIDFAIIRNKEKAAVEKFGITKFPVFVLIPSLGQEPISYEGDMKKESLVQFFSQAAPPNPDPAPKKAKASSSKKAKETPPPGTASADFAKASKAHKSSDFDEYMEAQTIILGDDTPGESPLPIVEHDEKPMVIKEAAKPIPQLSTAVELESACLAPKSGNCILVLLPAEETSHNAQPLTAQILASFAEVAEKHHKRGTKMFPFYAITADNKAGAAIRKQLDLKSNGGLEVLAVNMKRKWWRPYTGVGYDFVDAESFVDAIRLSEGTKQKLPVGFPGLDIAEGEPVDQEVKSETATKEPDTADPTVAAPEAASTPEAPLHNEL